MLLKATNKLGLFLMASLIMLLATAAASIGNMDLFSNAMAIKMNPSQVVEGNTELISTKDQGDKANFLFDISVSNVLDVIPQQEPQQQEAKISQQNSNSNFPPGLAGRDQITPDNLYYAWDEGEEGSTFVVDRATCDTGDVALSGGIQGASFDNYIERITDRPDIISEPVPPGHPFDSWLVALVGENGDRMVVSAFALCFDNPPLRP